MNSLRDLLERSRQYVRSAEKAGCFEAADLLDEIDAVLEWPSPYRSLCDGTGWWLRTHPMSIKCPGCPACLAI